MQEKQIKLLPDIDGLQICLISKEGDPGVIVNSSIKMST